MVTAVMLGSFMLPVSTTTVVAQGTSSGEIIADDQRYTFDREVPIDVSQLEQRTDDAGTPIYAKPGGDPLGAIYVAPSADSGTAARYLPQYLGAAPSACPSEAVQAGTIQGDGGTYVPAGLETDLTPEALVEIGSTDDGRTIYAPSAESPFNELFATGDDSGLVHYVLLPDQGPPPALPQQFTFAGQQFALAADDVSDVSAADLTRVGCAAVYPALASEGGPEGPFTNLYLQLGDRLIAYAATDAPGLPAPTGTPIVVGTPEPPVDATPDAAVETPATTQPLVPIGPETTETAAPPATNTPLPTETPAPTATAAPTETPAPTATAAPTETPVPTATTAPTETPDPTATTAPTETPDPTATTAPTGTTAPDATDTPPPTDAPDPADPTTAPTAAPVTTRPTPTPRQMQPQAVIPTLPADVPPPAVSTISVSRCSGNTGPIGDDGLPERLPTSLQYGGTGYDFTTTVPADEAGELTILGCVGPFEAFRGEQGDDILYLRLANAPDTLFRYEASRSFNVSFEVTNDPRVLTLPGADGQPDTQYIAGEPWVRSVYSSVSVILYVADPDTDTPEQVFAKAVTADVMCVYLPEGSADQASEEVLAAAGDVGLLPELTLGTGQTYVLASLWQPFGTTTNGWLTLYGPEGDGPPEQLVGLDPRRLDLLVFDRSG